MQKLIINFWNGRVALWRSYWLIGKLINSLFILLICNIEIKLHNNEILLQKLPFIYFGNFHLTSKFFLILWSLFITVGIWRAAENYKGKVIWSILTLIFLSYRIFTLRIMFY